MYGGFCTVYMNIVVNIAIVESSNFIYDMRRFFGAGWKRGCFDG